MNKPHPASFTPATLADQVAGILRIHVRHELLCKITPLATLADDLQLDSLSRTAMAVAFEDYFGIDIDDGQVGTWVKVEDITVSIMTLLSIKASHSDTAHPAAYPEPPLPDLQLANGGACS